MFPDRGSRPAVDLVYSESQGSASVSYVASVRLATEVGEHF